MELISVIMPVYNVAQFVEEAVECILKQTYKNIELIIVDDCSTDATYEILSGLSEKDGRIRLYRNKRNLKICRTLNKALSYASGSYIARMDGDDICDRKRLEILKKYLDRHKGCSLVGSQADSIDEYGRKLSEKKLPQTWESIKKNLNVMCCILHIWMAHREMYDVLKGYRDIPYAEDYDFLLRGMRHGFRYANVPETLYAVRIRNGNTQSSNGLLQAKAKYFVKDLYKKESRIGRDLFKIQDYRTAVRSSRQEKEKFNKAYEYMKKALESHGNVYVLGKNTLFAMIFSKYYMGYIYETVRLRISVKYERIIKGNGTYD